MLNVCKSRHLGRAISLLTILLVNFVVTSPAFAQGTGACTDAQRDSTKFIEPGAGLACNLERLYRNSIPLLLWLIILMIIVAGYVYITSGGNAERVKVAKDILGTTMIGAVLLLMLPLILEALGL